MLNLGPFPWDHCIYISLTLKGAGQTGGEIVIKLVQQARHLVDPYDIPISIETLIEKCGRAMQTKG